MPAIAAQTMRHLLGIAAAVALSAFALTDSSLAQSGQAPSGQAPSAQAWPQRPVRFVLPLGPGAGVDITARLVADRLSARWGGQSVVVENKPGGDGVVALTSFVGAKDDHTLLMSPTSSFTHHPWTHDKMPYDPREMIAIARMTNTIVGVAVPSSSPINSVAELVAFAKANPGKLNWATITGATDLVLAGFLKSQNLDMAKIPYRDPVQALNDVAEGRLHLYWSALAIVRAQMQAGRISPVIP